MKIIYRFLFSLFLVFYTLPLKAVEPDYIGKAYVSNEDKTRFSHFSFSSKNYDWEATSMDILPATTTLIDKVLKNQPEIERVYLPEPGNESKILNWQQRNVEKQPIYRSCIITLKSTHDPIAVVELHRMPRAVMYLNSDIEAKTGMELGHQQIMDFYKEKGLVTFDKENTPKQYMGCYRPKEDGWWIGGKEYGPGMVRLRVLSISDALEDNLLIDIIQGISAFIKVLSPQYPLHDYPTDNGKAVPALLMSYTEQTDKFNDLYKKAGFSVDCHSGFQTYWPNELRDQLPHAPAVKSIFISDIPEGKLQLKIKQAT